MDVRRQDEKDRGIDTRSRAVRNQENSLSEKVGIIGRIFLKGLIFPLWPF